MKAIVKIFYLIYQICIALPVILAATIMTAVTTIIGGILGNSDFWGYYPGMIWSRIICTVLLLPVKVEGKENIQTGRPYIIVANHQSAMDIFLIYGYLGIPFKWLMKKELRKIPLVGAACSKAGFIYIDRASRSGSRDSIAAAAEVLKKGMSMAIFPEGTRSKDGNVGKFKKGAFLLAQELGIELLPVTINGAYDVMSKQALKVTWHPMELTVHHPVAPVTAEASDCNEQVRLLSERTRDAICSAKKS